MINDIGNNIKELLGLKDIECVSRLIKKNIVFKTIIDNRPYAIKLYLNGNNFERKNKEELLYNYFYNKKIINVPSVYDTIDINIGPIMIIEWIDGTSIKNKLKLNGLDKSITNINYMLQDMNKIWNVDINDLSTLSIDKLGIDNRLEEDVDVIKETIRENKNNIDFTELFKCYDILYKNIEPTFDKVINSDISAHEYIIKNNVGYWIDFERYCIGDPNNDLARSFMSLTNGIVNKKDEIYRIYDLFASQGTFTRDVFAYFLIEKIMCSIFDAPLQISEEEISFYSYFVKEKVLQKKSSF